MAKKGAKKKGGGGASQKTQQKQKQKLIEDKTFGLKNKNRSKKVQEYVQQVKKQVNYGHTKQKRSKQPNVSKAQQEQERKERLALMYKKVVKNTGGPPKNQEKLKKKPCNLFAKGQCRKGRACPYSHDVEGPTEAFNLYVDHRGSAAPKSDIVCKHFLDAIEKKKIGWRWECPQGKKCQYAHKLPKGYVLADEFKPVNPLTGTLTLEEELEQERRALSGKGTPVTLERFLEWRKKKRAERKAKKEEEERGASSSSGSHGSDGQNKSMSGRQMFVFRPELFVDDDDADDLNEYEREDDSDDDTPVNRIEVSGTSITRTSVSKDKKDDPHAVITHKPLDIELFKDAPLPIEIFNMIPPKARQKFNLEKAVTD
mmetsp:Transcript_7887/g.11968  ORF Transcript_7887/g.11968 Transcript_7887/m.11968 type:complete len:370 (-) Transcript_7887:32-1141(-)